MTDLKVNRLLLQFEKSLREINREEINSRIPELKLTDLDPVVKMVARARAHYLEELFELAGASSGEVPVVEQLKNLKIHRQNYEELFEASKALEVAIERGYLDVQG